MTETAQIDTWSLPPRDLALPCDEVHVWRIPLDVSEPRVAQLAESLSADEQARAARFLAPVHGARFTVGRGMLRTILGRYLQCAPATLEFAYGAHGKPFLHETDLRFNLAHSRDLALLAVARGREIGADIEAARPLEDAERIVARFFSTREQADFFAVAPAERHEAFFRGWVRKEAYIKAIGTGLALPLEDFDVTLAPNAPPRLLRVAGQPDEPARWTFVEIRPGPGFQGAIAVEGVGWKLRTYAHDRIGPETPLSSESGAHHER